MNSKRGSYLMEAAVVLPVVLLAVITVILIIMYYYDCSVSQSELHTALRSELRSSDDPMQQDPQIRYEYSRRSITAAKDVSMIHSGLLRRREHGTIQGSIHVSNGTKYVLRRQKVSEFIETKKDE